MLIFFPPVIFYKEPKSVRTEGRLVVRDLYSEDSNSLLQLAETGANGQMQLTDTTPKSRTLKRRRRRSGSQGSNRARNHKQGRRAGNEGEGDSQFGDEFGNQLPTFDVVASNVTFSDVGGNTGKQQQQQQTCVLCAVHLFVHLKWPRNRCPSGFLNRRAIKYLPVREEVIKIGFSMQCCF